MKKETSEHSTIESPYNLRSGITIFPSQDEAIDRVLGELASTLPATLVLLTDTSGQVVSFQGDRSQANPVALGALVAGELAASQEMARITGEYHDSQLIIREGRLSHIFISEASAYLALLVKVPQDVPLGWARMLIQKAARKMEEILLQPPEQSDLSMDRHHADMAGADKEEIDLSTLVDNAFDELWAPAAGNDCFASSEPPTKGEQ